RLLKIDEMLVSADPISRLHLTQERIDLDAEFMRLGNADGTQEMRTIEREFVQVARAYGERNGVTYAAWRQVGVEADVLERAGGRVLVVSDLHLGSMPAASDMAATTEVAQAVEALAGPGVVVLAGDCLELLSAGVEATALPRVELTLSAHARLAGALQAFAAE